MIGIDFFIHNNKIYVIEIETCPGFTGFKKYTKKMIFAQMLENLKLNKKNQ